MTQEYFTIVTKAGLAKEAIIHTNGGSLNLTHLAVGDSNGSEYEPTGDESSLKHEVLRVGINRIYIDDKNNNHLIVEAIIPVDAGPFYIREIGVYDSDGGLFAIGKYPPTYKPVLSNGAGKDLYIRMILEFVNVNDVNLVIDPNVAICTEARANDLINEKINPLESRINEDFALKTLANLTSAANATTTKKGVIEIATITEANNKENNSHAITPKTLNQVIDDKRHYHKSYISGGVPSVEKSSFVSMSDNNSPAGEKCWATSEINLNGRAPWKAFNDKNFDKSDCHHSAKNSSMDVNPEILLRKMTSLHPISSISITSRNDTVERRAPANFKLVYTTDDMSAYSNIDTNLRNINFTIVKTITGATFTQNQELTYDLDSDIPTNATAWGILVTSTDGGNEYFCIGELRAFNSVNRQIKMSSLKARSINNIADINVENSILILEKTEHWSNGVVPSLTNLKIYIWAVYNNGNSKFVFDDFTGSHITGEKRKVASLHTTSSGNIVQFFAYETAGGGLRIIYNVPIMFLHLYGDKAQTANVPCPLNVFPIYTFSVSGYYDSYGWPYLNVFTTDGASHRICHAPAEGNYSQSADSNTVSHFINDTGSLKVKYKSRNNDCYINGYIDERRP
ncbi:MAG: phage tail protein [Alphaproteobacteria bacterium]|jgi:hypothetical protein|nr:phage tail protein [Alphaproteobacteria bacterium]